MSSGSESVAGSKALLWSGRIVSTLPVLMFTMSGVSKVMEIDAIKEGFPKLGYSASLAVPIGIVALICTLLYAIPRTAVLGAILLTGYLGGAIATHVRVEEPFIAPIILGVLVWLGVYLRDARLRALLPLRAKPLG